MQLHIKAAALMAATLVGGCGFVPKMPPNPIEGQRIPINLTAPNPRPWAGPVLVHPSQPELIALASTQTVQTPATSNEITATSDTTYPQTTKAASPQTQPPLVEESAQVAKLSPPEEPLAMWPVLLTFNPDEQLNSSATRLPSERVSFSWPEQPVKVVLPEPMSVSKPSPTLSVPSEASAQPVNLPEVKSESALLVASNHSLEATVTDHDTEVTANAKGLQDTHDDSHPVSQSPANPVEQGRQPDAVARINSDTLEDPAPQTEARPEPEPVPEPAPPLLTWSAQAGVTLSEMLSNWGADQGWIVRWASESDYRIEAPFSIQAPDFLAAASHVFNAYRDAGRSFNVTAYANQVLVVKAPTD